MPPNSALKDVQTDWNLTYQTNGEGLRDDEYAPQKRDGVIRIALIGDSYTFGQGCERGEIFPDILEATLRAEGYPVEVINVSNIGIGPDAYFLLLRDVAARYEPDIVILNVFGNDASDIYAPSLFKRLIKKASNYSHLLTLVRVARRKLSANMQGDFWQTVDTNVNQAEAAEAEAKRRRIEEFKKRYGTTVNNLLATAIADPYEMARWINTKTDSVGWADFQSNTEAMHRLCQQRGCKFIIAVIPDGAQVDPHQLEIRQMLGVPSHHLC